MRDTEDERASGRTNLHTSTKGEQQKRDMYVCVCVCVCVCVWVREREGGRERETPLLIRLSRVERERK